MKYTDLNESIAKAVESTVLSSDGPMLTSEIVIEVYGSFTENRARYVNQVLTRLRLLGVVKSIDGSPKKYAKTEKRNPLAIDACKICSTIKVGDTLDADGMCSTCRDLATQCTVSSNPTHEQKTTGGYRKQMGVFGNPDPKEYPINPETVSRHVRIMRLMIGQHVRVVLTSTGKTMYGILNEVDENGYAGIQTSYGPSVVNTAKTISIEPWKFKEEL